MADEFAEDVQRKREVGLRDFRVEDCQLAVGVGVDRAADAIDDALTTGVNSPEIKVTQ